MSSLLVLLAGVLMLATASVTGYRALRRRRARRRAARGSARATRVELTGDVTLAGVASFPHGLRVRGNLALAEGSRVQADVDVDGDVALARDARIDGPLAVTGRLRLASGATVGPAAVTGEATLEAGASVGGRLACDRLTLLDSDESDTQAPHRENAGREASVIHDASTPAALNDAASGVTPSATGPARFAP